MADSSSGIASSLMEQLAKAFSDNSGSMPQHYQRMSSSFFENFNKEVTKQMETDKGTPDQMMGSMAKAFERATGMLPVHYQGIAKSLMQGIGKNISNMGNVLGESLLAALGVAMDLQKDLIKVMVQNTGSLTSSYKDVAGSINDVSMATGIAQDRLVGITTQLSNVGLLGRMSKTELTGTLEVVGEWNRVFGMSAENIGKSVMGLQKLGISGAADLKKVGDIAFNTAKQQNLSLEEMNAGLQDAIDLTMRWGMTGVENTQAVVSGLMRAQGLYKELGLSTQAATEAAKKYSDITDVDVMRSLSQMSVVAGKTVNQLNMLRQQDFGQFMAVRADSALKAMSNTAGNLGLTLDKLYSSGPKSDAVLQQIGWMKKQIGMQFAMSTEEVDKLYSGMEKYIAKNTEGMTDGIAKHQKILQLQGEYIASMQKESKQNADANKSIEEFGNLWTTVLTKLKSLGQGLLVVIGTPLLNILQLALNVISPILSGIGAIVGFFTQFKAFAPIVTGVLTSMFLMSKFAGIMRLNTIAMQAFLLQGKTGVLAAVPMWARLKATLATVGAEATLMGRATSAGALLGKLSFSGMAMAARSAGMAIKGIFMANPLGLALTAIMLIVEYWDQIKVGIVWVREKLMALGGMVVDVLLFPFKMWWGIANKIFKLFTGNEILDSMKAIGGALLEFVMTPFTLIKAAVEKIMAVWEWWKGEKKHVGSVDATAHVGGYAASKAVSSLGAEGTSVGKAIQSKTGVDSAKVADTDTLLKSISTKKAAGQDFSSELGALSAKYESGSRGSSAIGFDKTGGASYGKYQIASKTGTLEKFMQYAKSASPDVYSQLAPLMGTSGDKSGDFANKWKEIAGKGGMGSLEHDFIQKTHFDPASNALMKKGFDVSKRSKALQDVLWSTSVQHGGAGKGGASDIFSKAGDLNKMSDAEIMEKVYAERGNHFGSSDAKTRASVLSRFQSEKVAALGQLHKEQNAPTAAAQNPAISPEAQQALIKMAGHVEKDISRRRQDSDYAKVKSAGRDTGDFGVVDMIAEGVV